MHNNLNISGCCLCTLNSAENSVFLLYENADNQYCFGCAKVTAFTGKERDSETGFSYFGARYYDSDLSGLFLSIDPMSDKYPSLSPYAYCAWNPIKLVDPDGRDTVFVNDAARTVFNTAYNEVLEKMAKYENKNWTNNDYYRALVKIKESFDEVIKSEIKFHFNAIIRSDDNGNKIIEEGYTYGKPGVDGICVEFSDSEKSLVHETRHALGYINGEWDVDKNRITKGGLYGLVNYDYQDEFEAYSMANYYGYIVKKERLKEDWEIRDSIVNDYKVDFIIPEFHQYTRTDPYNK